MNKFAREALRKFGSPQAIARRLGMDEQMLSNGLNASEAQSAICDMIEDLDGDELVELGQFLKQLTGDSSSRGLKRAAADARERLSADSVLRSGMDRFKAKTAGSVRARAADARREANDARMRGDSRRAADAERRAKDAEEELDRMRSTELGHERAEDRRRRMAGDSALVRNSFEALYGKHAANIESMGQAKQ